MKTDRDLFLLAIFTFMTVAMWITFEFLRTSKTTTVSGSVQQIIVPLTPNLDTDTLTILESKRE